MANDQTENFKKQIWTVCKHEWERDYSAMGDDPFKYMCKSCKLYKNSF